MQVFLSTRSYETALLEFTPTNKESIQYSRIDFYFITKTYLENLRFAKVSLFLQGEPPKGLYFIAKGSVFLTTEDHAKVAELYETDFFGEGSIVTSTDRSKKCLCDGRLLSFAA